MTGKLGSRKGLYFGSVCALCLVLAGCQTIQKTAAVETPRLPEPISLPGGQAQRVSGALKPGGGQAVQPRIGQRALGSAEIIEGTPQPVPQGHAGQLGTVRPGEPVGLNFVDAEIGEVVDVIVSQFLGRNYIIDPAVSGRVTMRTTERIPREFLVNVLENILAMHGAALVADDTLVSVVPAANAPGLTGVAGPVLSDGGIGEAVFLLPLHHASAESVRGVAQAVLSPGQEIFVEPRRNYLMFSGTNREAQAVQDLVRALDVSVLAGRSFGLFPLQVANADEVAGELELILDVAGNDGPVKLLPIARMNAILVIANEGSYLSSARSWVERLDRATGSTGSGAQIYVYHVRNGRAAELASMLGAVFGGEEQAPRRALSDTGVAPTLAAVSMQSAGRSSSRSGEGAESSSEEAAPAPTPAPAPAATPQQRVFAGSETSDIAGGEGPAVRFIADERNNAIMIVATPTQYELAKATLDRLDIVPLQVLVEVTIAEVTLNDDLQYGLQWFFESGNFSTTLTNDTETGAVASIFPGFNAVLDARKARSVLSALSDVTDVKVISSPQLMVLDNQIARLHVGDQVPIVTQASSTTENTAIINSVQMADTGVILEVTPRVNSSGLVTLDVKQDVSDAVRTESSGIDSPTIEQRTIETTVAVQSGETVALGGLIRNRLEGGNAGVPVLKDIPVVGSLFGTKRRFGLRTELLVLITPNVLRDTHEARLITRELRDRLVGLHALDAVAADGRALKSVTN